MTVDEALWMEQAGVFFALNQLPELNIQNYREAKSKNELQLWQRSMEEWSRECPLEDETFQDAVIKISENMDDSLLHLYEKINVQESNFQVFCQVQWFMLPFFSLHLFIMWKFNYLVDSGMNAPFFIGIFFVFSIIYNGAALIQHTILYTNIAASQFYELDVFHHFDGLERYSGCVEGQAFEMALDMVAKEVTHEQPPFQFTSLVLSYVEIFLYIVHFLMAIIIVLI